MTALDAVTKASEDQFSTARLWKGEAPRKFRRILAALEAQDIPMEFNETVTRSARRGLFRVFMGQVKSTFAYEVWVFSSDLERACIATGQITRNSSRQTLFKKLEPPAEF